ncbi:aldo-keto reductase AKR2E4-like isoform X2 [Leguminivora glycinivorella]|uniref:aldo-keto reductase AKR2E4-like isoform X2 n=1 Tax=Leguminivora glycinivorella TaxID=1035111 RepID=UPI00200C8DE7|nr:aldo-keto reductase AKR2E4-like isoform X2 [Leguminivora glycinivorella]
MNSRAAGPPLAAMLRAAILLLAWRLATSVEMPKVKLNDGREMPALALGTYLGFNEQGIIHSENHQLRSVISQAIDVGYRHFDTAAIYGTEGEVGEGVAAKIKEGVRRSDIFVTTKLWNTHHKREQVAVALQQSLKASGLDYVDLYLMHWPMGFNDDYSVSKVDYMETWRGMEDAHKLGLVKSIGVSNFNQEQLGRLLNESRVHPSVLQIEVHPQLPQTSLVSYAQSRGLVVMGYSPFGAMVSRFGAPPPKKESVLKELAEKYGKSEAQIVLRWLVDRNIVPIPKTVNPKRLEENINIFDFKLEKDEIQRVNTLDTNTRFTLPSFWQNHPYYPFDKVDNPIPSPFV